MTLASAHLGRGKLPDDVAHLLLNAGRHLTFKQEHRSSIPCHAADLGGDDARSLYDVRNLRKDARRKMALR